MDIPIDKEIQELSQDYNTLAEVYKSHSHNLPTQRQTELAEIAFRRLLITSSLLSKTRALEITPGLESIADKACSNANTQQARAKDLQHTQKYLQYCSDNNCNPGY